jgi:hypothetical protein
MLPTKGMVSPRVLLVVAEEKLEKEKKQAPKLESKSSMSSIAKKNLGLL